MPLPPNTSLSLQGQLRSGTKPKLALVVRMTEEALDSLQQLDGSEQMEFEFGDRPGIHIRTAFFPLNIQTTPGDSELYIRTTTHARPTAPLKLSAALAGRIRVERTSATIPDKVMKRINDASAIEEQKKDKHKVILLDKPPPTTKPIPIKSKTATKIMTVPSPRNTPMAASGHSRVSSTSTLPSTSNGGPSAHIISLSKDEEEALTNKLTHFLALGSQPFAVINKEAGGDDALTSMLLSQIGEQEPLPKNSTVQQQDQLWRLKPRSWLDVRPYTYPNYSPDERMSVSRSARIWFGNMKIHDGDPLWEHVRFRQDGTTPATTANIPSSTKERKVAKRDVDVKMKSEVGASSPSKPAPALHTSRSGSGSGVPQSESASASARLRVPEGDGEREEGELSASSTPPPARALANNSANGQAGRKQPGSKPLIQQNKHNGFLPTRPMTPPVNGNASNSQAGPSQSGTATGVKRSNGPVDARSNRRPPPPEPSERVRALPPIAPPIPVAADKNAVKRRDALPTSSSQPKAVSSKAKASNREREREREENKTERERDREKRERERDAKQQERELAKEKEKKAAAAALANRKLQTAAASTPPIPTSSSNNAVSKKRARAEASGDESDWSDIDFEALRKEKRRRKEEKLRESGVGVASNGKAEVVHKSSKLERAYERERDTSTSRRAASPPPRKTKREERASIPPASQEYLSASQQGRSSNGRASSSKATSSNKVPRASVDSVRGSSARVRRPSPKFTSDEEEGEEEEERPLKASSASAARRGKVKKDIDMEQSAMNTSRSGGSHLYATSAGSARPSPSPRPSHALPHKPPPPPPPASAPVTSSTKMDRRDRSPTPRDRHERVRARSRSPAPRRANDHHHHHNHNHTHRRDADAMEVDVDLPLPSDREGLRERYTNTYASYIDVFQKMVTQKHKISRVLQSRNSASGSASVSESDEADMMSPEEIEKLSREHRRLHVELETIRSLHAQ